MHPVRVLFGALPATLHTILSEAIRPHADIEVVGDADRPVNLLVSVATLQADVVVVAMADDGLPGIVTHLLDQYPQICVLAVTPDGRRAIVTAMRPRRERIALPSPEYIVAAIRSLGPGGEKDDDGHDDSEER